MASVFDYIFNLGGNFSTQINGMTESTGRFNAEVKRSTAGVDKMVSTFAKFGLVGDYFSRLNDTIKSFGAAGISLDSQLHDLSAIAGVTGEGLKEIEGYARESAKAFGIDASQAVESYKLLLSQLSPELGKYPEALKAMGNSVVTTSKLMGGDATAAAQVLTTAMNQYGVSLDDPMKASAEMARMMNVMAAAGQAGSAELPAIAAALSQCGMAAKSASISFEETNAAIQVLDKAGKKGSEAGVALRNVLTTLSKGRFLPKNTQEELLKAGIDVQLLSDKTKPLKERLESLKPVLNDDALLSAFFGRENANAARALIQGTESLQHFTDAVTGTTSAEDQAAIIMDSYAEKAARVHQKMEDLKISAFQATNGFSIWIGTITETMVPFSQLIPLVTGLFSGMKAIAGLNWSRMWIGVKGAVSRARLELASMNVQLRSGNLASMGFAGSVTRAALSLVSFATVGIAQGLKALGSYLLSLVTTGTAQATFAATSKVAWTAFKTSATSACRAVGLAISSIPIIGWIAAAITAIALLWKYCAKFRAFIKGIFAAIKADFQNLIDMFKGVGDFFKALANKDKEGMKAALNKLGSTFKDGRRSVSDAYHDAYDNEMARSGKGTKSEENGDEAPAGGISDFGGPPDLNQPTDIPAGSLGGLGTGAASGSGRIKNVTVNVEKLVERFEINTTNLGGDMSRVKDMVAEALLGALNDVNLAM